jgi:membrane-associated protease RseP (regulator of RpoE activity)
VDLFKPFPLILIHTPFGLKFFDRIAKTRAARIYAKFNIYLMPLITAIALILIISSIAAVASSVTFRETARGFGPQANLLIPGINPILPIGYTLAALIISVFIHEAGHGIVARVHNLKVESTGIVLALGIPVGAFVNIEREELARASMKQRSAVLTAGPLNNMILATVCFVLLYVVVSTLVPISQVRNIEYGVIVSDVTENSLAKSLGLTPNSVLLSAAGREIHSPEELRTVLLNSIGTSIPVSWQDHQGTKFTRQLSIPNTLDPSKPILGVSLGPLPVQALELYKRSFTAGIIPMLPPPTVVKGFTPYSDEMSANYYSPVFGPSYPIIANMLYWLWFINFNLGIFNALPIGPLDGGQLYGSLIESRSRLKKERLKSISTAVSWAMFFIVIVGFVIPYLPF